MLRCLPAGEGIVVGRLHVATLRKRMAIEAIVAGEHVEAAAGPYG